MHNSLPFSGVLLGVVLWTIPATAQNRAEDARPSPEPSGSMMKLNEAEHRQMIEQSKQMEQMAKAMTSMAQMCETMMTMEMKNHPLKVAAVSIVGGLLTIALFLFVVLEVEWIRYWHRRLKGPGS